MTLRRAFERRLGSLDAMVAFVASALAGEAIDAEQHRAIDFAIEELFTNMIKYSASGASEVEITLALTVDAVDVTLVDTDVAPFDVSTAPDADVALPLAQRTPGGLGLHLVRRLVESLSYEYLAPQRAGRTRFRVPRRRRREPMEGSAC